MATMTVAELRDYVRTSLGADEMEIPDTLVDVWIHEATSHIQSLFEPWQFYETSIPITIAANSTALTDIDYGGRFLQTVTAVQGDSYTLEYLPHESAVKKYAWGSWTGLPIEWSINQGFLWLWPSPDTSNDYTIWGHREVVEATLATDTPDLPLQFHPLIAEWALARGYEFEDDEIMSAQKFNRVEQQLSVLRARFRRAPSAGIQKIGGVNDLPAMGERLLYDWEGRA